MASEIERIRGQMRQGFEGGAWHGPALLEVLEGVDHRAATRRPVPEAHSIWEIVLHLTGTQAVILRRLRGDAGEMTPEEDWPPLPEPSEAAWSETLATLRFNEARLQEEVGRFPDDRLDQPLVPGGTSAYNNLHGMVQHTLYHAGQIALLRKSPAS